MDANVLGDITAIESKLRDISNSVWRRGRKRFATFGITSQQFATLVALYHHGNMTMGELSTHLYLAPGTISPLVDQLEKRGYAVRERDVADRRVIRVRLLEPGLQLHEEVIQARQAYLSEVLESLSEPEKQRIASVLHQLHDLTNV